MEALKKIILSDPKMREIYDMIIDKAETCWKRSKSPEEILRWLNNFSKKREIYLALILANNILYYTLEKNRSLWRLILMNRVKLFLLAKFFPNVAPPDIEEWFQRYVQDKCVFVGFGEAGKSAQSMVYYFKQAQITGDLSYMERFQFLQCSSGELSEKEIVFLLDDFIGSGDQAEQNWFNKESSGNKKGKSFNDIHKENPQLQFFYLALVGCNEGKKLIEAKTPLKIILGQELDETFKCFSDCSMIYTDANERAEAKRIMKEKGRMLHQFPLGYKNMQLAIAFYHNTPDNSLPVIWKKMPDESWYPLFERFE